MTRISQTDAVVQVTRDAGGVATLAHIYQAALHVSGTNWSGTQNPFANIRRIVQTSGHFFRVRPGLWALKSEEARLRRDLELPLNAPPVLTERFDHSYYQGLLLELGRMEGWQTFVPAQDKNRRCVQTPLHELATLDYLPPFTFDRLLRHARTIDVAWINERQFPHAFFEVEHSTDIYNSLRKFTEFQDLRTQFFIVADAVREGEWRDKMQGAAFTPLRGRVDFLKYETLSNRHSLAAQSEALKRAAP